MNFRSRIDHRIEKGGDFFSSLRKWIAESQSLYSTTEETRSWLPKVSRYREALLVIFLGLFRQPWNLWEITEHLSKLCYNHRYSEGWDKVQKALEQVSNFEDFEDFIFSIMSENDFFGNFLMEAEKFLRRNPKSFKEYTRDRRRPRYKVYRRGYNDKGSLRPYSKRGRNLPDPNPGEDRRSKVKYQNLPYFSDI